MNGFIMRNGNFIECNHGENHSSACHRLGYNSMQALYDAGLLRISYIGNSISVDGLNLSHNQFLTLRNRCIHAKRGLYISLFDKGSGDFSYVEMLEFDVSRDLLTSLRKD